MTNTRYRCLLCGRDKFTAKQPHNCNSGYRKRHLKWEIIEETILKFTRGKQMITIRNCYTNFENFSRADVEISGLGKIEFQDCLSKETIALIEKEVKEKVKLHLDEALKEYKDE